MVTEITSSISAVSRLKAANGDPTLSSETLQAIQNGVPAPIINETNAVDSSQQIAQIQPSEELTANEGATADLNRRDAVILDLSQEAQDVLDQTGQLALPAASQETIATKQTGEVAEDTLLDQQNVLAFTNGLEEQAEQVDIIA